MAGAPIRKEILYLRHKIFRAVREWFYSRGFIEVQTPVTASTPIPESSLDLFEIKDQSPVTFLLPSPELYLKPLLSEGLERYFEISPAFRKGERGQYHLPEFTMLEWYRSNAGYRALMEDCHGLIAAVCRALGLSKHPCVQYRGTNIDLASPFEILTVEKAFTRMAGWNPILERNEERFDQDLVLKIEPGLPAGRPVFLVDFPAWAASLSRLKNEDKRVCERVELYIGGLELANGFSELVDPSQQEERFRAENRKRGQAGLKKLPMPREYLSHLKACPPSAGMALGMDRLVMLFANLSDIARTCSWNPPI